MRYADTLLIEGEEVALRTRQHWLAYVISARYGFILWIVAVLLLVAGAVFGLTGMATDILGVTALVMFIIGLIIAGIRYWQWWAQDYMVTSRRLMKVWGVLNKRSVDSALEHINDARLDQSFFGRLLNYGHLEILTAAEESTLDDYDMIRDPKGFKKVMLTQKHALDSGYRHAPSPPLRTTPPATPPAVAQAHAAPIPDLAVATAGAGQNRPTATGDVAMPPTAPAGERDAESTTVTRGAQPGGAFADTEPPGATGEPAAAGTEPAAGSLEVTQTLARLADLRDRGAISAEEYEAKKRELLDRL